MRDIQHYFYCCFRMSIGDLCVPVYLCEGSVLCTWQQTGEEWRAVEADDRGDHEIQDDDHLHYSSQRTEHWERGKPQVRVLQQRKPTIVRLWSLMIAALLLWCFGTFLVLLLCFVEGKKKIAEYGFRRTWNFPWIYFSMNCIYRSIYESHCHVSHLHPSRHSRFIKEQFQHMETDHQHTHCLRNTIHFVLAQWFNRSQYKYSEFHKVYSYSQS